MKYDILNVRKTISWILFCGILLGPPSVCARVYIDITSPYLRKIPIAVPYLEATPKTFENDLLGRKIAEVLGDDLDFHGFFAVLDPSEYGGRQGADWDRFRLDYLVRSTLTRKGNALVAEFRLVDMTTGRMVEGRRYTGAEDDYRAMAHRFCDLIVKIVTEDHGVSLSRIAFTASKGKIKDVYTADFDGANIRRETSEKSMTVSPRYSPDGRYLAFTSYRTGRPYLYLKEIKTGKIRELCSYPGLNIAPSWHPDGKTLAVTLSKDDNPDIYVVDLNGRIKRRLTKGFGIKVSPTWSPDGRRLAFVSDRTGTPQIYVMDVEKGSVRRLTYTGNYNTDPQWSPREDRIAFTGRVDGQFQVFTISPEGGEPEQLTLSGHNENPSWSPDGRQILFSSTRLGGGKALFVMFANGRGQRLLLQFGDGIVTPHWGPNIF
jgi:TolB protein